VLRRWAGRAHATGHAEPPLIRARWEELLRSEPEMSTGIAIQRTVQGLQRAVDLGGTAPPLDRQAAADRLHAGVPLLQGAAPFVAVAAVAGLFHDLAKSVVRGEAVAAGRAVLERVDSGVLDLEQAVQSALALDTVAVNETLAGAGAALPVAAALLQHALAPAFHLAGEAYAPLLVNSGWGSSGCPVCGAQPLLGELRGGESRRVLRCGRCGASWEFQRLRCVYCDSRDHKNLTFWHVAGQSDFLRIDTCDGCGGYIKSMARLDPIPYELLPAEDLATAPLDIAALERGYGRPAVR